MPSKKHRPEEIIGKLREAEVVLAQGATTAEASRECMALPVARKLKSDDVLAALAELFVTRGPPAHIRSDNVLCWEAAAGTGQQISLRRM